MGLLHWLEDEQAGITKSVPPKEGVAPAPVEDIRERLRALASDAVRVEEDGEVMKVAWHAEIWNDGRWGGGRDEMVRGIEVSFDEGATEAHGIAYTYDLDDGYGPFHIGKHHEESAERGQFTGGGFEKVVSNLGGEHGASGGAEQSGSWKFDWKDIRQPVIEAVVDSGWTYVPKKV